MRTLPWHERLFRALLRIFPAEFRGDFGDAMAADFRDQQEDAARSGSATTVLRVWLRTVAGFVRRAPLEHLEILARDARYALRVLRGRPAFAGTAILTIAAAVGLNAAVFSVVHGVLLRGLPVQNGDRLVRIFELEPPPARDLSPVSPANFLDWEGRIRSLDAMAFVGADSVTLIGAGDPEQIPVMAVSGGFFNVFPGKPILGRLFSPAEAGVRGEGARGTKASPQAMVLGYELWQRQFGGRPDVVGRTVRLEDSDQAEIVGVMGPDFAAMDIPPWGRPEAWLTKTPDPAQRRARFGNVVGRLAPGTSVAAAQAELDVLAVRLAAEYPGANAGYGTRIFPLLDTIVSEVRAQLWFLSGAAFCVLLIGCANVVNLLIAWESSRRHDLATRLALGASRAQLLRQTLTQGVVLAVLGGAVGFLIAILVVPALVAAAPLGIPRLDEVAVDARVLVFTTAVSLVIGIGCGLVAHLSLGRLNQRGASRLQGADTASSGRRFRQGIAVAEIAIALVLVVAAGLMVRTFNAVGALKLGFDPTQVISVGLSPDDKWRSRKNEFESELVARVRALPGVVAAGIGSRPLTPGGGMGTAIQLPGEPSRKLFLSVDAVTPGFLEALGTQLVEGRFFGSRDTADSLEVAVVNEAAARVLWADGRPLGRSITIDERPLRIVGVLADVRRDALEAAPPPTLYVPSSQNGTFWVNNLLIRTAGDPMSDPMNIVPAVRAVMRQIDPVQALTRIQTLEEALDLSKAPRRFMMQLAGIFSALALALAMIGIYGVAAGSVVERVPEIGIRITCGATTMDVMRMVAKQGAGMVVPGIALGLIGAAALSDALSGLVFGVQSTDPATYIAACACLVAAATVACAFPARRAAAIDPVVALKQL